MSGAIHAWCFSHGRMHTFGSDGTWCGGNWVDLGTPYLAVAEDEKRVHFGDARFMHELPAEAQEAVMAQVKEREMAA